MRVFKERYNKFTLLELLVALAIIGILLSILIPSLHRSRLAAKTAMSMSNLKQIYKGTMIYASQNSGWMCLASNNPGHYGNDMPNWRVLIYESIQGENMASEQGARKEEMENGGYRDIMYCPITLDHRGGYPPSHGEGRGHYGMNKYFGITPDNSNSETSSKPGYKHIAFASLNNEYEPFLMPTRKSGSGQKNTSGHNLGGGLYGADDSGNRGYPSYLYPRIQAMACMLDGSISMKSVSWGSQHHNKLKNDMNFK